MLRFRAPDGTKIGYLVSGDGIPVICLPGAPMQDSDAAAQAHQAAQVGHRNAEAAAAFGADGAFDPAATRAALATFDAPVLLLGGEVDLNTVPSVVAEFAALFPNVELVVQRAASHFPRLDDADRFGATTSTFLG